ncbi:unnamed protein product [Ilex paraguariensis]|uniref:Uncharacterized protein n=1 Tax=Ilex paraguariensis TaxID=185542 RepID=A0ABC8QYR4_9AQUA
MSSKVPCLILIKSFHFLVYTNFYPRDIKACVKLKTNIKDKIDAKQRKDHESRYKETKLKMRSFVQLQVHFINAIGKSEGDELVEGSGGRTLIKSGNGCGAGVHETTGLSLER